MTIRAYGRRSIHTQFSYTGENQISEKKPCGGNGSISDFWRGRNKERMRNQSIRIVSQPPSCMAPSSALTTENRTRVNRSPRYPTHRKPGEEIVGRLLGSFRLLVNDDVAYIGTEAVFIGEGC
jgi:hypothetical protein